MKKYLFLLLLTALLLSGCGTEPATPTLPLETTPPATTVTEPPLQGWQEMDGHHYYYTDGIPHTGWLELDGSRYFFRDNGQQHTGWLDQEEGRYFLNAQGIVTGWQRINGKDRYFNQDGILSTGWVDIDGQRHLLDNEGAPCTGWQESEGNRYYLNEKGVPLTSWQEIDGNLHHFSPDGTLSTGWLEEDGIRCYLDENGSPVTGWQDLEGNTYLFKEDGTAHTGWYTANDANYYFKSDGIMAIGKAETDRGTRYFTSTGKEVILVNPWNTVPQEYSPNITGYQGWQIDASCKKALTQMIQDCASAGHTAVVVSAYRSNEYQRNLFQNRIQRFVNEGYDREEAERLAAMRVARPGTSEHELGLALDIVDVNYQNLNEKQETMPAQIWLMENSWRYGFILRYPNGTTESTGIIYEPWHYRYVGIELSTELHESGLCLEEYLNQITQ